MKSEKEITYSLDEIDSVAAYLNELRKNHAIFTFTGSLGAGKTTLIRTMLAAAGVSGPVTSPTFTYMHKYENAQGEVFYHFDLYRMKSLDEFMYAGFDEYLYVPGAVAFIEWPEIIMPLLKSGVCHCSIEYVGSERRIVRCGCSN